MSDLRIAKDLALPLEVVTQATAILAKRRMGKSYLARKLAEGLFLAGQQLVIIDPKGDWWGIRSSADGKSDGLPILIIGGEHGDIPLEPGAGEVIARLVVEEAVSVLLDLSELRKHEIATFMVAFLETLYRLKAREQYRTPVMVLTDEADAIAPQKPQPNEARMVGAFSDLVRRGGQRGIGVTFITQRSAVLSKDVLTQAQILITLRVIAPQDIAAIQAWIDVHGSVEERKTLMQSLPSLPVGDAWVWSPGWPTDSGIFQRIHALPISTFDSGATPKPGQRAKAPKRLADIDLEAVKRQMAETLERAKASDPKALRARVVELERQLAEKQPAAAERVEVPMFDEESFRELQRSLSDGALLQSNNARGALHTYMSKCLQASGSKPGSTIGAERPSRSGDAPSELPQTRERTHLYDEASGTSEIGKCERALLTAWVQHGQLTLTQASLIAGYSVSSSTPSNAASKLRSLGYVDGSNQGGVSATSLGKRALGHYEPLPTGRALAEYWFANIGKCEGAILRQVLKRYPKPISLQQAAEAEGYSTDSSTPSNAASKLRTLALIHGKNSAMVADERLVG